MNDLDGYIEAQGPFDGVIGFSLGAVLASSLLVRYTRLSTPIPFKLAIFFSGSLPSDPNGESNEEMGPEFKAIDTGEFINIPTAHVWGRAERGEAGRPWTLRDACAEGMREELVHDGGHEIPGSKDRASVMSAVKAIRRTIWRAQKGSHSA